MNNQAKLTINQVNRSSSETKERKMNAKKLLTNGITLLALLALATLGVGAATKLIARPGDTNVVYRPVYDATGAREAAIFTQSEVNAASRIASPVYDATAAREAAIFTQSEVDAASRIASPVYDATGAMLDSVVFPQDAGKQLETAAPAPVYDATGAMLEAIVLP